MNPCKASNVKVPLCFSGNADVLVGIPVPGVHFQRADEDVGVPRGIMQAFSPTKNDNAPILSAQHALFRHRYLMRLQPSLRRLAGGVDAIGVGIRRDEVAERGAENGGGVDQL